MLTAGDEFARTQQGNNNAYCQDNEISWVDWTLREKHDAQVQFVRKLARLRHKYPILRRNIFLNGEFIEELGVRDVTWITPQGAQMSDEQWHDPGLRCFGMLLDGRAQTTGIRQTGKEATLLIVINGHHEAAAFVLPECAGADSWSILVDTNVPDLADEAVFAIGAEYCVTGRSVLLFVLNAEPITSSE